jgi:pyruvate/2-oxoglutarate dehydrogenase complex dihydrolipoamide acyltransferase (E2) component
VLENGAQNDGAQDAAPSVRDVAGLNGSPAEVRATDAARRKAREMGVDLSYLEGTGNGGQITVEDVRRKGEN